MPTSLRIILTLAAAALPAAPALAQDTARADSLYAAGAYAEAAAAYQAVSATHPRLGFAWYNAASARAARGETDAALDALEAAADARFLGVLALDADTTFDGLRDAPRFGPIRRRMEEVRFPCRFDPVHDQLDFWVGTWDVYLPGDVLAGRNVLTEDYGNCAILEAWQDRRGGRGTSLNWWDPGLGKWVQRWVSDNGSLVQIEGNLVDGAMVLTGRSISPAGAATDYRMTVSPNGDGTVRQLIETSADGGATWTVGFDGRYVPVEPDGG